MSQISKHKNKVTDQTSKNKVTNQIFKDLNKVSDLNLRISFGLKI